MVSRPKRSVYPQDSNQSSYTTKLGRMRYISRKPEISSIRGARISDTTMASGESVKYLVEAAQEATSLATKSNVDLDKEEAELKANSGTKSELEADADAETDSNGDRDDDDLSSLSSNSDNSIKGINDSDNEYSSDDGESLHGEKNDKGANDPLSQQVNDSINASPKVSTQQKPSQPILKLFLDSLFGDKDVVAGSSNAKNIKQSDSSLSNVIADTNTVPVLESVAMATGGLGESCSIEDQSASNAEPLVANTQAHQGAVLSNFARDDNINDDDGCLSYAIDHALDEAVGPGTSADLMVLDYISQRVIDKVVEMCALDDDEPSKDAQRRQLECLGREQVMVRRLHFTRSIFLLNDQRPEDEADMAQWAESMHRVNMASFVLMIMCPQLIVSVSSGCSMPNRKRSLISAGLSEAIKSFFPLFVPQKKRDNQSLDILLDMQTQQWLIAADDERQLQSTVKQVRAMNDGAIAQLLAIDSEMATESAENIVSSPTSNFEALAISEYRQIAGRRLNKISGRRLHIARLQYTLAGLQKRVAQFVGECVKMLSPPVILARQSACNDVEDISFMIDEGEKDDDAPEDTAEQREPNKQERPENNVASQISDAEGSDISGDFEVTIFQDKGEIERLRRSVENSSNVSNSMGVKAKQVTGGGGVQSSNKTAVPIIDPSFTEERRMATFIRDALSDEHLDMLINAITSDTTDIQTMQNQILDRLSADSTIDSIREFQARDAQDGDDGFRLDLGDRNDSASDENNSAPAEANGLRSLSEHRNKIALAKRQTRPQTRQLRAKRANVNYSETGIDSDDDQDYAGQEEDIINVIARPKKRGRVQYGRRADDSSQSPRTPNGFRGRRGIPAEDPATFGDQHERIRFTPSVQGSPSPSSLPSPSQQPEVERSAAYMSPARPLGQYEPARMVRDESVQTPVFGSAASHRKRTRSGPGVRHRWTQEEEECFIRAVCSYGLKWSLILKYHGPNGSVDQVLRNRTRVHLKDKARNIKTRLVREGKRLGPFRDAIDR
ncbi:TTAGGG repeat binding factor [Coemansia erecta]|nr:TTAGGG repeat binding factor [Coemansia erecta]